MLAHENVQGSCMVESSLGRSYRIIYDLLCGRPPRLYPWHFQWLATYCLYPGLKRLLPAYGGRVLDAGCGSKPYLRWFGSVTEYVGLDVASGPDVDLWSPLTSDGLCPMKDLTSFCPVRYWNTSNIRILRCRK